MSLRNALVVLATLSLPSHAEPSHEAPAAGVETVSHPAKRITVGVSTSLMSTFDAHSILKSGIGLRADVDFSQRGPFLFGASLGAGTESLSSFDQVRTRDVLCLGYVAATKRLGRNELRATLGAGFVVTNATAMDTTPDSNTFVTGIADLSLTWAIDLTPGLALGVGPDLNFYAQEFHTVDPMFGTWRMVDVGMRTSLSWTR
ncbi:MAG: hypothetical protein JWO36_5604 [Myxococcales bacterium]|nr:hypothetical protein [Myxococcales bacterium]